MNKKTFIGSLHDIGAITFGEFTLKSGLKTPYYIDLRILISFPKLQIAAAELYLSAIKGIPVKRLAAVPYAAIPIGAVMSVRGNIPLIFTRKEKKEHGLKKMVEGIYKKNDKVIIVDDLITTGLSKKEVIDLLRKEGLIVKHTVVLIDRQQGGVEDLKKIGVELHSVFTIEEILKELVKQSKITRAMEEKVVQYLHQSMISSS